MKSNDISDDQTNLIPTTIIDEEPELTTDVDLTQVNSKSCLSKLCIKFSKGYKSYTIIQLSTSTLTTSRFWIVILLEPICPGIPFPLNTLPGVVADPFEP